MRHSKSHCFPQMNRLTLLQNKFSEFCFDKGRTYDTKNKNIFQKLVSWNLFFVDQKRRCILSAYFNEASRRFIEFHQRYKIKNEIKTTHFLFLSSHQSQVEPERISKRLLNLDLKETFQNFMENFCSRPENLQDKD